MSISILDHELPEETYNRYDLTFFDIQIPILLTFAPPMVDQWIADLSVSRPQPFLVGLDVEWRPNFSNTDHPVATIQLCASSQRGPTCLIFQILHSPHVPQLLLDFLDDTSNTFVGVGIDEDAEKLLCDYGLRVAKTVDLRDMAPREMKKAGLKTMAQDLLGKDVQKPKTISRSRWDYLWLTSAQVQYACLDAFLSYEIGRRLSVKPQGV